jgi:hypothetical protein
MVLSGSGSTMVEHSPHHPKDEGSIPVSNGGTGRKKIQKSCGADYIKEFWSKFTHSFV